MSTRRREPTNQGGPHFPEAVAQWRLALRTEIKSTSSLPTSMFHAHDPMLETMLAQTTENMLARLLEPAPADQGTASDGGQRTETVTPAELQALPQRLRDHADAPIDLDDGLAAESLAVLADACCSGHEAAAAGAAGLLRTDLALAPGEAPAAVAARLSQLLQRTLADRPVAPEALASLGERLAAAIARRDGEPPGAGGAA